MADQPLIERFTAWMDEQRLPLTPQRLAIARLALGTDGELSAEDVTEALAANGLKVGAATVYRTLDVLVTSGLLDARDRGEGFRRFAPRRGLPHVEQLLCTRCGGTEEVQDAALDLATARIADRHGFVRERHRLVVYGVCAACAAISHAAPLAATRHEA